MLLINALILGLIEGVTEFLPISSTAHLIITSKLLNIPSTEFVKLFEVVIQSGAILAVALMYITYCLNNKNVIKNIIFSFIPTAIIGLLMHKIIKTVFFESYYLIIGSMFVVGLIFIIIEILINRKKIILKKNINQLTIYQALLIGFIQALAIIPGVSRAGSVIIGMMILGYKRSEAALYSFLLAIPTILAASTLDLYQSRDLIINNLSNLGILAFGFFVSFVTAYFSVSWLVNYLKKNSLVIFGIYRILTSIVLFVI